MYQSTMEVRFDRTESLQVRKVASLLAEALRSRAARLRDLDQRLTTEKQALHGREVFRQDFLEARVRGVSDREPQDLRWRTELFNQADKVLVFGQHDGSRFPGRHEDLSVSGVAQAEFPDRFRLDVELRGEPRCQVRR